jgi:flagellar motor switch/type III secretory pathway protein FliN
MGFLDAEPIRSLAVRRKAVPKDPMIRPRTLEGVRPFPWRSLETITRAEVSALRDVRRWSMAHVRLDGLALALEDLLGARLDVLVGRACGIAHGSAPRGLDGGVGVVIAPADADTGPAWLIEAEGALAATVVARALRRPPPSLIDASVVPSDAVAGAFAAVILAAARRAHAGVAMRVLGAGPAPALESDLARVDSELVALSLTVLLADDAFAARVIVPRSARPSGAAPRWETRDLVALGAAPLALPIVACAALVAPDEVAVLSEGDAVVSQGWPLARAADGSAVGPVWLAPPSSDLGLRARLCEDGRLVLGAGGLEPLLATEAHMDTDEKDALVATLGEVPIVMRVEIGEALMTAREWATLGRGDVISLGRRVGERVLLRVGGVPVARGELVDLEGEVAVRIVERLLGEGTKA